MRLMYHGRRCHQKTYFILSTLTLVGQTPEPLILELILQNNEEKKK